MKNSVKDQLASRTHSSTDCPEKVRLVLLLTYLEHLLVSLRVLFVHPVLVLVNVMIVIDRRGARSWNDSDNAHNKNCFCSSSLQARRSLIPPKLTRALD